jgi:carbon storage regulator
MAIQTSGGKMLVLTRKPGQSIMIGDGIEVQVLSVAGEKVRLGITAPREVGIFRNEVYERIEVEARENGSADDARERVSSERVSSSSSS